HTAPSTLCTLSLHDALPISKPLLCPSAIRPLWHNARIPRCPRYLCLKTPFLFGRQHILLLSVLLPPLLLALALFSGSQNPGWLLHSDMGQTVLWQLRLPRALLAFLVGALLAWAGVLIQGMVRNP